MDEDEYKNRPLIRHTFLKIYLLSTGQNQEIDAFDEVSRLCPGVLRSMKFNENM